MNDRKCYSMPASDEKVNFSNDTLVEQYLSWVKRCGNSSGTIDCECVLHNTSTYKSNRLCCVQNIGWVMHQRIDLNTHTQTLTKKWHKKN